MLQEKQENDVRNKINPNKPIAKIKSMPAKTKKADMLDDDDSDNELQVIYLQNIFSGSTYFKLKFSTCCKVHVLFLEGHNSLTKPFILSKSDL